MASEMLKETTQNIEKNKREKKSKNDKLNPSKIDKQITLIMSKIKTPRTIGYLSKLINTSERNTRKVISIIRKHHPVFAFLDGTGYKYASKKEALKLISFERNLIKNHQKNLKVLLDYVGV